MDMNEFEELFKMVEKHLVSERNTRINCISPHQKFAVTIEYLASGSLPRHMASIYRISKQHLGTIIDKVCKAITAELMPSMPVFNKEMLKETAIGFEKRWQFPHCIGAMDGKHVSIQAPPNAGSTFYNYKGYHSIVLFAVADWRYKFTYLDIGAYGSKGDANIFANSSLGKAVMADNLEFPPPSEIDGQNVPCDDAFPLGKRIMKPFATKPISDEQTIFNYQLSRARRCIENAFGILCVKWLCLKRTMLCHPEKAQSIVVACCLLHNFLLERSTAYCPPTLPDRIDNEGNLIEGELHNEIQNVGIDSLVFSDMPAFVGRQCDIGKIIRNHLMKHINSPQGAVEWQRNCSFLN